MSAFYSLIALSLVTDVIAPDYNRYIAELAPSRIRGTLVTFNNLFITGGQAISALVAVAFSFVPESLGWRFMLGIGCVPSIIQFLGFLTLPESPR